MHDDEKTYYLAASYVRRHHARTLRDQIAIAAPKWRCTSRWLDWENSDPDHPVTTAAYDASDVLGAQALVFVAGPPYTPGKSCELGLALATSSRRTCGAIPCARRARIVRTAPAWRCSSRWLERGGDDVRTLVAPARFGVDPVSWTPRHCAKEVFRWQRQTQRTRRSTGARWCARRSGSDGPHAR